MTELKKRKQIRNLDDIHTRMSRKMKGDTHDHVTSVMWVDYQADLYTTFWLAQRACMGLRKYAYQDT